MITLTPGYIGHCEYLARGESVIQTNLFFIYLRSIFYPLHVMEFFHVKLCSDDNGSFCPRLRHSRSF